MLALALRAAAQYQSAVGDVLLNYANKIENDSATVTPYNQVTAYSNGGRNFGYQFHPTFQSIGDPTQKYDRPDFLLKRFTFPTIAVISVDEKELENYINKLTKIVFEKINNEKEKSNVGQPILDFCKGNIDDLVTNIKESIKLNKFITGKDSEVQKKEVLNYLKSNLSIEIAATHNWELEERLFWWNSIWQWLWFVDYDSHYSSSEYINNVYEFYEIREKFLDLYNKKMNKLEFNENVAELKRLHSSIEDNNKKNKEQIEIIKKSTEEITTIFNSEVNKLLDSIKSLNNENLKNDLLKAIESIKSRISSITLYKNKLNNPKQENSENVDNIEEALSDVNEQLNELKSKINSSNNSEQINIIIDQLKKIKSSVDDEMKNIDNSIVEINKSTTQISNDIIKLGKIDIQYERYNNRIEDKAKDETYQVLSKKINSLEASLINMSPAIRFPVLAKLEEAAKIMEITGIYPDVAYIGSKADFYIEGKNFDKKVTVTVEPELKVKDVNGKESTFKLEEVKSTNGCKLVKVTIPETFVKEGNIGSSYVFKVTQKIEDSEQSAYSKPFSIKSMEVKQNEASIETKDKLDTKTIKFTGSDDIIKEMIKTQIPASAAPTIVVEEKK